MKNIINFFSQLRVNNKAQLIIDVNFFLCLWLVSYKHALMFEKKVAILNIISKLTIPLIIMLILYIITSKINKVITKKLFS